MADEAAVSTATTETSAPGETQVEAPANSADTTSTTKTETGESTDESTTTAAAGDKDTTTDAAATGDKTEAADDSTAEKDQSRLGFQLRQIRTGDAYVSKIRKNLEDNYVNEAGLSPEDARIRKIEANDYIREVETSRAQLVADNEKIAAEISLFNPNSKDFDKNLWDRSLKRFGRDSLVLDENGDITGFKTSLLDYMREEADSYLARSKETKAKSNTATAEMAAASEEPGSASSTRAEANVNPLDKAFDEGFDSVK